MKEFLITEMTVEREDKIFEVKIEGYIRYSIDKHYQEDADRKGGYREVFVEDIEDFECYTDNGVDFALTGEEKEEAFRILEEEFLSEFV